MDKFCRNCGAKLNDGAKFCGQCGTPLDVASANISGPREKERSKIAVKQLAILAVFIVVLLVVLIVAATIAFIIASKYTGSNSLMQKDDTGSALASQPVVAELEAAWKSNVMMSDSYNANGFYPTSGDPVFGSDVSRGEIISISFLDTLEDIPEDAWDISEKNNGNVMAWIERNGSYYDLFIAGNGGVCAPTSCGYLFCSYVNLEEFSFNGNFHTDQVTDMSYMFFYCSGLTELDVSNFDTSKVTDMNWMFSGCSGLTDLDVNNFDTSKVTNMSGMFSDCPGLTNLDVSNFNTSKVTDMGSMFASSSSLTNLNVSNFDTSKVTDMGRMFGDCSGLTELDVSNFDTSKVTDMNGMFRDCSSLTELDVSSFDTSKVTDMGGMFRGCSGLTDLDVSNFDTSNVKSYKNFMDGTGWEYLFT